MGLVSSAFNSLFGKSKHILMIGLDGSGKTTILYRLKLGKVVKTSSTIGVNVEDIEHKGTLFTITDAPNTRKVKSLKRIYLENTDGVIFVIDAHDRNLIKELRDEVIELLEIFYKCPLLILANKQDMPNAMTTDEITETLNLDKISHERWFIQGTSATEGYGLNTGLDWLAKELENKQNLN